jgi:inhibitor of KinA sporulation pathway (predicted exonuclease)
MVANSAPPTQPGRLTRRYFLATEQSLPDGTQYDVEVFINASWIRVVKSSDPQVVTEITRYLRPGANKVTLSCAKKLQGVERHSTSPGVTLKVVVGAGNVGGDHVMIDDPLAVMTRTAAEVDDKVEEFVFEAR